MDSDSAIIIVRKDLKTFVNLRCSLYTIDTGESHTVSSVKKALSGARGAIGGVVAAVKGSLVQEEEKGKLNKHLE